MVGGATVSRFGVHDLGIGVGLRTPHYAEILADQPDMDWFEVISENYMVDGGKPLGVLDEVRAHYPVITHGVSLNLGGRHDPEHARRLRALLDRVDPAWFSDHLCLTGAHQQVHDLLPLPYVPSVRDHVIDRIKRIQDDTGRLFAVENVSSYLTYSASEASEWDFLAQVVEGADCALLLDVNNIFVSACNHGFDPQDYLARVPTDRVVQIHLAGHSIREGHRLDTHDHPVCDEVWDLYAAAIRRLGAVTTLIEWDDNIPTFARLQQEAQRARAIRDEALVDPAVS